MKSPIEKAGESRGSPAMQPVAAHAISLSELEHPRSGEMEDTAGAAGPMAQFLNALSDTRNPLRQVKAKLTICVGAAELTVGELLSIKEGQVLRLDRGVEQPVDVLLEGQVVARGTLVAVDDQFAVRVTELPVSLERPLEVPRKA